MAKTLLFILTTSILIFVTSCTPKVVAPVVEEKPVVKAPTEPTNPCATLGKLSPRERDQAETAYVLYKDNIKLKDYKAALPLWRTAYKLAPAANGRIKYQFDDGVTIFKNLYKTTEDPVLKKSYIDTIFSIYDKRVECFGEPAYVEGRKAFDSYYTFSEHVSRDETFDMFKGAIDGMGDTIKYFVVNPFTKLLYDKVVDKSITKEEGSMYAKKILNAVEFGMANCEKKECEAWDIVNDYAPARLESLEGIEGFYDCAYFEEKYFPQYLANPDDCGVINGILRKLRYGKCTDERPKIKELVQAKANKCYTPPPAPGLLRQAYTALDQGQYQSAVGLFEQYINEKADNNEKKAKYSLIIAKIYYGELKNFPKARKYALKAADYRQNWGEPFILIGKLYASSGPLCGPGRGWDSQIVTWPAIDKFQYAKKIDPSVADEANKWISQYRKYMPSKEDIFQRTITEGSSFKVGCWIQENTTVRTAP